MLAKRLRTDLQIQSKRANQNLVLSEDVRQFYVRNLFQQDRWNLISTKRLFASNEVVVWMDTIAAQRLLTSAEVDSIHMNLQRYLLSETDSLSANSCDGIIEILEEYFGIPPDIDGDGIVNIVLIDIQDTFEKDGSYVCGFFDPNDLTDDPHSNLCEVIFIDIYPTIKYKDHLNVRQAAATIAHELQHLIRAHYEVAEGEYVFINEGLSEFAEIICGFPPRKPDAFFAASNRPLLSWNTNDPIPDYARASLWTEYLFEQIGYSHIKDLVQTPLTGTENLKAIFQLSNYLSFQQVFMNWSIANIINDTVVSPEYGYQHPMRENVRMPATQVITNLPVTTSLLLPPLNAQCLSFPATKQIIGAISQQGSSIKLTALEQYPDGGQRIFQNIHLDGEEVTASHGRYGTITLVVNNLRIPASEDDQATEHYDCLVWGKKDGRAVIHQYDDGVADIFTEHASYLMVKSGEAVAVKFSNNVPGWLYGFSFNALFLSEVEGSGIALTEERDINAQVFDVRNGIPDHPLSTKRRIISKRELGTLGFEDISLANEYASLSALADTFCIVLSNDEDDNNFFALGLDNSIGTTFSSTGIASSDRLYKWKSFEDLRVDTAILDGWNAMVRANCLVPEDRYVMFTLQPEFTSDYRNLHFSFSPPFAIDTAESRCFLKTPSKRLAQGILKESSPSRVRYTLPLEIDGDYTIALHLTSVGQSALFDTVLTWTSPVDSKIIAGNMYPNPTNAFSIIPLVLSKDGMVEVELFNLTGQKVALFAPQYFGSGVNQVRLGLSGFSSGIYFSRIVYTPDCSAEKISLVRKFVFLK